MKPKTIEYYDWFKQVQPELCRLMGIDDEYFRDYHKIVGGDYKDFWHVYLTLFDIKGNDTFYEQFWDGSENNLSSDLVESEYGKWALLLIEALDKLHKEYGEELLIWISW